MSQPGPHEVSDSSIPVNETRLLANSAPPSESYLGTAWDGNLWRFPKIAYLKAAAGLANGEWFEQSWNVSIKDITDVSSFIRFSPRAWVESVEVVAAPCFCFKGGHVTIMSCLSQAQDAAPDDEAAFLAQPSCSVDFAAAFSDKGYPAPVRRVLPVGEYGVARQLKPTPLIGGSPRINVRVSAPVTSQTALNAIGLRIAYVVVVRRC